MNRWERTTTTCVLQRFALLLTTKESFARHGMNSHYLLPWLIVFSTLYAPVGLPAQNQRTTAPSTPTFRLNSTLVFLDVTVLDKNGRPVVTGLRKDDFTITEDKKPQRIF